MTNKHMKSCSTSSAMMEMQIKTEENNQVTPTGMAIKKRKIATTRCGEIGTTIGCWWECKMVQLLWKTVWQVLNRLTVGFPYDQDLYSWVCIYTRDWNMSTQKLVNKCSQCHFHNSQKRGKTLMFINWYMGK